MMTNSPRNDLSILTVPAFQDNYLWLIHDGVHAAVVDPGAAEPILEALAAHHLTLTAILLTHHHADHIGGVPELLRHFAVPVYGPHSEKIAAVTAPRAEGEQVLLGYPSLSLQVIAIPGHTRDHIAYLCEINGEQCLFSGDTLFGAGCGRVFDGSAPQLHDSLNRLATLPDSTLVYCAHEYTLANLRFAHAVEPGNAALTQRIAYEQARRRDGIATCPTTIGVEKATNPFLRHGEPAIVARLTELGKLNPNPSPVEVFTALRTWKNIF